jgi:hypothetical protein
MADGSTSIRTGPDSGVFGRRRPIGGEAVQATHRGEGAAFESVDGKFLYFTSGDALFRVPVGGGEEKQVASGVPDGLAVTSKGNLLRHAGHPDSPVTG